jgi:UDP-glucose 4-epimerase
MKKRILVTGGLGFIGSHTIVELLANDFLPVIVDNLKNSRIEVLEGIEEISGFRPPFYAIDVSDKKALQEVFDKHKIDAVIHFAAYKAVGESVSIPLAYYQNNIGGLITLLEVMEENDCRHLVFSSSCTVYGEPITLPVKEDAPVATPSSPYGNTKKVGEEILKDCKQFSTVALRYFNPIGAHPSAAIGELPLGVPNNLVPYITQTAIGMREKLTVFGNDYPTPDGTCIRDYLHVCDLANAHMKALIRLQDPSFGSIEGPMEVYNLGTGVGYSVQEVLTTFEKVNGISLPYQFGPRRQGDVMQVWANADKAAQWLHWKTERTLEDMLRDAWRWQQKLSK